MNRWQNFKAGLIKDNPVFSLYLGICSTLAITTTVNNAIGMGVAVIMVLIMSNVIVSCIRKITPDEIRIPVYIVIIASLVTIIQMLIQAFAPSLNDSLGVFIPLIVVNCIILGRAEAFASKNTVLDSAIDGLGMGLGYTLAVIVMSFIREILATGGCTITNPFNTAQVLLSFTIIPEQYTISMFGSSVGAFVTFAILAAIVASMKNKEADRIAQAEKEAKKKEMEAKKQAALANKKGANAL
ncbi:electron transport complex subunit RsxE [Floccifex sp.]|uniref:electron transport complex subunit RsxE n=1 Tax=Floccifex sp. TaxID=2815810 RepID=UPI003F060C6E